MITQILVSSPAVPAAAIAVALAVPLSVGVVTVAVVVVGCGGGCGEREQGCFEQGAVLGGAAALQADPAGAVGC
jgi:hypothetical protein